MKIAGKILSILIIVVLIAALALFTVPRLFGIKMYSVVSGSMEPAYSVGDVVYAFNTKPEDIEVGDVITYVISNDTYATHRVIEVEQLDESPTDDPRDAYRFYTQGDANPGPDGTPQIYLNVIGVVRFSIPKVGLLLAFIKTTQGMIISVTVLLAVILLSVIFNLNASGSDKQAKKGSKKGAPSARAAFDKKNFGRQTESKTWPVLEAQQEGDSPAVTNKKVPPKGWGSGKR